MSAIIIDGVQYHNSVMESVKNNLDAVKSTLPEGVELPTLAIFNYAETKEPSMFSKMKKKDFNAVGVNVIQFSFNNIIGMNDALNACFINNKFAKNKFSNIITSIEMPIPGVNLNYVRSMKMQDLDCLDNEAMLSEIAADYNENNILDLMPCTPNGVIAMLYYFIDDFKGFTGKKVVVIGRSIEVGLPLATMLIKENATVSVLHSKTKRDDMVDLCRGADIVISATGHDGLINADMIKPGAICVGIGPYDFTDDVFEKAGYITARTKCVGLYTRAIALKNYNSIIADRAVCL